MPLTIVTTEDVPQSNERLTAYENHFVMLVPIPDELETVGQTRFGNRPSIRVQGYVYKDGEAYDLGVVPVFQGTIRALIRYAAAKNSVVAGFMHKENNRWVFTYDVKNKEHAKAFEAISAVVDKPDAFSN